MSFNIEHATFVKDPAGWKEFTQSPKGAVGLDLIARGEKLKQLAYGTINHKTGLLGRSLEINYHRGIVNPHIEVGSPVKYAYYVHEGTAPHLITPKTNRTVRFVIGGKVVYAEKVHHPGTKPTKFLSRHLGSVVR